MPDAKLDNVSCKAKPSMKPAMPRPASMGPIAMPSWESAIKMPMIMITFWVVEMATRLSSWDTRNRDVSNALVRSRLLRRASRTKA
jgi:hypothetical protein